MTQAYKICALLFLLPVSVVARLGAQGMDAKAAAAKPADTSSTREDSSVTQHTAHIGGQTIPYTATVGSIAIKNAQGETTALMYYTAYVRSDTRDVSHRPIAFLYNGGPGSASIWVHMGAFGPRRVATKDADYNLPPYQLTDNQSSLLDHTDMVFIDPVGTGFSHTVGKGEGKDFWGVDPDIRSVAQLINRYVTRNGRWSSPKFLIGESYGTFRSAALSNYLQSQDNMTLNGIVLMSSVLDLSTITFPNGQDLDYILYLPSYAATAWYYKLVKDAPSSLPAFLDDARKFAVGDYSTALMKGSALPAAEKAAIASRLAHFTGLSVDYLMKADLRVAEQQFTAELLRSRGLTAGRLDARFSGPNGDPLTEFAGSDPQSDAISGAYTAAFNSYLRDELEFTQDDRAYVPLSLQVNGAWDWRRDGGSGATAPNAEGDLAQAMLSNPNLQVEIENGYFDLATPFFATEYTREHLGLPDNLLKNIQLQYYDAGHMMYAHDADLAKLKANIAAFIDRASRGGT